MFYPYNYEVEVVYHIKYLNLKNCKQTTKQCCDLKQTEDIKYNDIMDQTW